MALRPLSHYLACNYLAMLESKLIHVNKMGPCNYNDHQLWLSHVHVTDSCMANSIYNDLLLYFSNNIFLFLPNIQ